MDGFVPPAATADLLGSAETLVRRYGAWLRDKLRLRYGDQAEDLAQEALLRTAAHESANKVEHHRAFLLTVADNLARDRARREQRERAGSQQASAFRPLSTPACQEHTVLAKQIVLALTPELRDALVLTQVKGLTYQEAAAQLSIPARTVKDRVRRALAITSAAMRD